MRSRRAPSCHPYVVSSPLWSRAPSRDENGKPYIDFMMIIPGLKTASAAVIEGHLVKLQECLDPFQCNVAYVDLNVKLNLLWVSARPVPGLTRILVEAIQRVIPQARVVTADFNPPSGGSSGVSLLGRLKDGLKKTLLPAITRQGRSD